MFEFSQVFPMGMAEFFGTSALIVHLVAYAIYAKEVFHERVRPNVVTWFMWLFGGVVEYATYEAIPGSNWATNALPLACVIGITLIAVAICVSQIRNYIAKRGYNYHSPSALDYAIVVFDMAAAIYWLLGGDPFLANAFAVGTSFITFIPLWRTTYINPEGEKPLAWVLWSVAYTFMLLAIMTGPSKNTSALYFFPLYYLLLHIVVVGLSIRSQKK